MEPNVDKRTPEQHALAYAENIIATLREPFVVLDKSLRVRTANTAFYRDFHVSKEETQGRFVYDLGNGQWDIPQLRTLLSQVLSNSHPVEDFEVEHAFPAIGKKAMLLNARRFPPESNDPELLLLAIEDVTDRRRAEAAVQHSEVRYRRLFEKAKDGILILDADTGKVIDANPFMTTLLGYSHTEFLGKELWEIGLFRDIQESRAAYRELQEKGYVRYENLPLESRSGQKVEVEFVSNVYTENHHQVVQCNIRDITERRQMLNRVRESEDRLASELRAMTRLQQVVARLLVCPDLGTALNEVLDATITLVGSDMGTVQVLNPQTKMLEIVAHRGFKDDFLDHFRTVSVHGGTSCGRAMKDGQRVIIEDVQTDPEHEPHLQVAIANGWHGVQSTPLMGRNRELLGMLSTHYRQPYRPSERDLRILDLYARPAADFIERIRVEEALREADCRKNEFLAMLAHELRNPLAPIRNAAQILQLGGDERAVRAVSDMMDRQVGQMVRLVDDLLDVSRISRGKIELRKERVELASVVHHAVEAAHSLYESMNHDLTVTLPSQPIYLNGDPTRLAQIVGNLLNNACKFTDTGGRIRLTVEREGEQAVIQVRDSGIGIAADQLPRIFDMFTQVDCSLERSTSGLGIGLSLVKNLVEMHGGTVEVHSAGLGQGSEFVVRLPVLADMPKPPPEPAVSEPTPTTARRILVVDDNRDSANSLAMLLKLTGHETHTAYDGLEAVESAATLRPDVVLLDIGLPKLNGYEAARQIRQQPWGKGMVLVALTGWGQAEDRQRSEQVGFDAHMVKPVDLDALRSLLARPELYGRCEVAVG